MKRRAFLAAAGTMSLAGCSSRAFLPGTDDSGIDRGTPYSDPPRVLSDLPLTGWPMGRGGRRRRGRASNADVASTIDESPDIRWTTTFDTPGRPRLAVTPYAIFNGQVGSQTELVYRRNPTRRVTITAGGERTSPLAVQDKRLYFGSEMGLHAVDAATGTLAWYAETGGHPMEDTNQPAPIRGTPAVHGGTAYAIGLRDHGGPTALMGFETDSGTRTFTAALPARGDDLRFEPLVDDRSALVVVVPSADGSKSTVLSFDQRSGDRRWRRTFSQQVPDQPNGNVHAVSADDEFAYVPSRNTLHALTRTDGETAWTYRAGDGAIRAPVAVGKKRVYLTSGSGHLHAIDRQSGESSWTTEGEELVSGPIHTPPALGEETVFVAMKRPSGESAGLYPPSSLVALDRTDGSVRWTVNHDGRATPPVVGKDGVYVAFWTVRDGQFVDLLCVG